MYVSHVPNYAAHAIINLMHKRMLYPMCIHTGIMYYVRHLFVLQLGPQCSTGHLRIIGSVVADTRDS